VDDFGTGYSSLSYLQRLPVTEVKIDRSFVTPLGSDVRAERFFRAIINLAHTLGLHTVAEGVETETQWRIVESAGCDAVQGWLISKALDAASATKLFSRPNQRAF
jgi:EAL domain-containing protein (putative c-di-GMP-specific phosphodiesterase class I)